ncbi:hypothetical protein TRFO_01211 [Tritrichomonas foetus]|uniref:Rab-GAP TBC domain-containing protein n=1 Tax=Tritrichomonas foetus TaxID=1144522 RepID=A0A1J4KP92_9EUKA|nr:hypothetical protein TRFO_01211 [Tritrichomonas foetus]|eukprot:OHT11245.1 hypothetical protein TRFO_01211 [Tritrichomonas foetus]
MFDLEEVISIWKDVYIEISPTNVAEGTLRMVRWNSSIFFHWIPSNTENKDSFDINPGHLSVIIELHQVDTISIEKSELDYGVIEFFFKDFSTFPPLIFQNYGNLAVSHLVQFIVDNNLGSYFNGKKHLISITSTSSPIHNTPENTISSTRFNTLVTHWRVLDRLGVHEIRRLPKPVSASDFEKFEFKNNNNSIHSNSESEENAHQVDSNLSNEKSRNSLHHSNNVNRSNSASCANFHNKPSNVTRSNSVNHNSFNHPNSDIKTQKDDKMQKLKEMCYKNGIQPELRCKIWPKFLNIIDYDYCSVIHSNLTNYQKKSFETMTNCINSNTEWVKTYKRGDKFVQFLRDILISYALFNPAIAYPEGLCEILIVLTDVFIKNFDENEDIVEMQDDRNLTFNEARSYMFGIFCSFIDKNGHYKIFLENQITPSNIDTIDNSLTTTSTSSTLTDSSSVYSSVSYSSSHPLLATASSPSFASYSALSTSSGLKTKSNSGFINDHKDINHSLDELSSEINNELNNEMTNETNYEMSSHANRCIKNHNNNILNDSIPEYDLFIEKLFGIIEAIDKPVSEKLDFYELKNFIFICRSIYLLYARDFNKEKLLRLWDSFIASDNDDNFPLFFHASTCLMLFNPMFMQNRKNIGEIVQAADTLKKELDVNVILKMTHNLIKEIKETKGKEWIFMQSVAETKYLDYIPSYIHFQ